MHIIHLVDRVSSSSLSILFRKTLTSLPLDDASESLLNNLNKQKQNFEGVNSKAGSNTYTLPI